jgi:hypothetical protein
MISPFAHMGNQKTGASWIALRLTPGMRPHTQPQAGELGSHTYQGSVLPHSQEKGGREGPNVE